MNLDNYFYVRTYLSSKVNVFSLSVSLQDFIHHCTPVKINVAHQPGFSPRQPFSSHPRHYKKNMCTRGRNCSFYSDHHFPRLCIPTSIATDTKYYITLGWNTSSSLRWCFAGFISSKKTSLAISKFKTQLPLSCKIGTDDSVKKKNQAFCDRC